MPTCLSYVLLVAEGLSRAIGDAKARGEFQGISISQNLRITHLLFVDDVLLFCCGRRGDAKKLSQILEVFGRATRDANKWTKIYYVVQFYGGRGNQHLQGDLPL
jgi:hypothetical protein